MNYCSFPLHTGGALTIASGSPETDGWLESIRTLTGGIAAPECAPAELSSFVSFKNPPLEPGYIQLFKFPEERLFFYPETLSFQVLFGPAKCEEWKASKRAQSYTGYLAVISAVLREMMRGKPIMLMHGALLASCKGTYFFCGKSGIGKSTTSRRWSAAGGKMLADDMALLEFADDGIWAHPLPTWSLCAQGMEGLCYPFDPPRKLDMLIALGRDPEHQQIRTIPPWQFYQIIYSASVLFCSHILKKFPAPLQKEMVALLQRRCDELSKRYPPQALLAHLDGDLKETLAEYL